jgi:N-acetylmuramoyl-L-alanine amidase
LALAWCTGAGAAPTVVVDTGHSLAMPGVYAATGNTEFAYNLLISNRVAERLQDMGMTVLRSGQDGKANVLTGRTRGTAGVDLFISIHHDSMQQSWLDAGRRGDYSGFAVFVSDKNPQPQPSLACAKAVGQALVQAGEHPSLYHATAIAGENRPLIDRANGVHRFDNLAVLRTAKSPAILLEVGVIVNPAEAQRLAKEDVVAALAAEIADGVAACLAKGQSIKR